MKELEDRLSAYDAAHKITQSKGNLCVMLVVTRKAKIEGLPLHAAELLTEARGQIAGLGRSSVQRILNDYGERRILAAEGGRTSRGSIGAMQSYVAFLNDLHMAGLDDVGRIESWWIERVRKFFESKPFLLRIDASRSLRWIIDDLFSQAAKKQKNVRGSTYVGALYQHLVGACLNVLDKDLVEVHHGFSVADASTKRSGDFVVDAISIHVTTSPTEQLVAKCSENIDAGIHPVIISNPAGVTTLRVLCENRGIENRVDLLEINQFVVNTILGAAKYNTSFVARALDDLLANYNAIIEACETDPSLRIEKAT